MKPLTPEQYAKIRQYYSDEEIRAQGYEIPAPVAGTGITPGHSKFTPAQLAGRAERQVENAQDAEGVSDHPLAQAAIAAPLAVARGFPGGERAAVGMSLLGRLATGDSPDYGAALQDEEHMTDDTPGAARFAARIAGGSAALGSPGLSALTAPAQGAVIGGSTELLSPDEMSPTMRGVRTVGGGAMGWAGGSLLSHFTDGPRVGRVVGSIFRHTPEEPTAGLFPAPTTDSPALEALTSTPAPAVDPAAPDISIPEPEPQMFRGRPVRSVAEVRRAARGMTAPQSVPSPRTPSPYVSPGEKSALAQLMEDQEGIQPDVPGSSPELLKLLEESLLRARR